MNGYILIREGTLEVIGATWSTDLDAMKKLAPKLVGIVTTARFLLGKGVKVVVEELPGKKDDYRPRKMYIGEGANRITLMEATRPVYGGFAKSQSLIVDMMANGKKRLAQEAAA